MQIDDLNVVNAIVELQSRVMMLESVLNFILERNTLINKPDQNTINQFDAENLKKLQSMYPNMGIRKLS
jgi:hypothetical protein